MDISNTTPAKSMPVDPRALIFSCMRMAAILVIAVTGLILIVVKTGLWESLWKATAFLFSAIVIPTFSALATLIVHHPFIFFPAVTFLLCTSVCVFYHTQSAQSGGGFYKAGYESTGKRSHLFLIGFFVLFIFCVFSEVVWLGQNKRSVVLSTYNSVGDTLCRTLATQSFKDSEYTLVSINGKSVGEKPADACTKTFFNDMRFEIKGAD